MTRCATPLLDTTWDETIRLLPLNRNNRLRLLLGQDGKAGQQDFRWVET